MIDRILRSRGIASSAVAGLTLGLSALATLALWSNESTARATSQIRTIDAISNRWGEVFLDVSVESEALADYLRAESDVGREPLKSALGSAAPQLQWLRERPEPLEASEASSVQTAYGTYTYVLKALIRAAQDHRKDEVGLDAEQASLIASSLSKQALANVTRKRLEMQAYLADVERYNTNLRTAATVIGGVDALLLALCSFVLLGHQRRMRHAVRQSQALSGALSEEKSLLAGVISSIPHLVYWKDADLRYVSCNQAFLTVRGLDGGDAGIAGVVGRSEDGLAVRDEVGSVLSQLEADVLRTGAAVVDRKVTITTAEGQQRTLLLSVLPHARAGGGVGGTIGVGADVTVVTELERHLAQASRLESIGQLAAGIAHEINTPVQFVSDNTRFVGDSLTPVIGGLRELAVLAEQDPPADDLPARLRTALDAMDVDFVADEVPDALTQSLDGLNRVAQIVRAMKDFSHPGQGRSDCDLNRAVESTVQVSRSEWKTIAELSVDLDPDVRLVPCYEGELKQVLLNVIVNAAQAIGEHHAATNDLSLGHITVTTRRDGDVARITISDDGPGMDAATQQRVFDPFFTTKQVGKGTGQGLSMAHSIIASKHGGTITVESSPGAGATFLIALPYVVPDDGAPAQ